MCKNYGNENLRVNFSNLDYARPKTTGECGLFQVLGYHNKKMMQAAHCKLYPRLPWQKNHSTRRRLITSKLDLYLGKKSVECYTWNIALFGAEIWTIPKVDQKYLESL
jgi:hypothetical protein